MRVRARASPTQRGAARARRRPPSSASRRAARAPGHEWRSRARLASAAPPPSAHSRAASFSMYMYVYRVVHGSSTRCSDGLFRPYSTVQQRVYLGWTTYVCRKRDLLSMLTLCWIRGATCNTRERVCVLPRGVSRSNDIEDTIVGNCFKRDSMDVNAVCCNASCRLLLCPSTQSPKQTSPKLHELTARQRTHISSERRA